MTSCREYKEELCDMTDFSTKIGPSTNIVSEQSGDGEKRNIRNSALKIFHRYRRHKSISSGTPLISDTSSPIRKGLSVRSNSASSASIDKSNRTSFRPFERRTPRSFTSELGTVTVLKPVSEFSEPYCPSYNPLRDSTQSRGSIGRELQKKIQTLSYVEASSSREFEHKCNSPLKKSQETVGPVATLAIPKTEAVLTAQNGKWARQDSPTTESLRSERSSSRISNSTFSRAYPSEVSTSRGTSPDLYPPRTSSKYYYQYNNERLVNTERNSDPSNDDLSTMQSKKQEESSSNSSLVFTTGTAKLARSFSGAGIEKPCIVRCSSPSINLGASSVGKSSFSNTSRPNTPVSIQLRNENSQSSLEYKGTIHEASWIAPVKLGRTNTKSVQENNGNRCLNRSSGLRSHNYSNPAPSVGQSTSSTSKSSQSISISRIMTVAKLTPDFEQFNDPALVTISHRNSKKLSSVPAIAIATPLNYASSDSEDLETDTRYSFRKQHSMNSLRSVDPFLSHPRAIRRSEIITSGSVSIRELDLNTRLCKMERDNALLLSALEDIVKKFGGSGVSGNSSLRYEEENGSSEVSMTLEKKPHWCDVGVRDEYPSSNVEGEQTRTLFNRVRY